MPPTKTVTLHLTADPNLQVHQNIRNGEEVQIHPAKRLRFRSGHKFSLLLSPSSPFVDGANPIDAIQKGDEWLVDAQFRADAATAATKFTVAISQEATMAARAQTTSTAAPQVEIIIEQY